MSAVVVQMPAPEQSRAQPYSREAEQSVIGSLLQDNTARNAAAALQPADFFDAAHRAIYGAILGLIDAGKGADCITTFERLQSTGMADECGGLPYLTQLEQCVATSANVSRYVEIVRERAARRRIIAATDEIARAAFAAGDRDVASILEDAEQRVRDLSRTAGTAPTMVATLPQIEARAASVTWIVKGAIQAESIGMLYGGPGTFKSFIALDLALHVAHGLPWLGRRTRQGAVVYIAAEGGAGLWSRIKAWHKQRRMSMDNVPLYVVPMALDIVAESEALAKELQRLWIEPALIVVDTLSQTYRGEENSANEMAAYLSTLGVSFRERWRCAVMVIHHTGHAATERPRGSSAIKGALEFMFGVFRDETERFATMENYRQKDSETIPEVTFYMTAVSLGVDADGDQVSQLVASHLHDGAESIAVVKQEAENGRKGRTSMLLELLQAMDGQAEKDVRVAFLGRLDIDNDATKRQVWKRSMGWATRNGIAVVENGTIRVLRRV